MATKGKAKHDKTGGPQILLTLSEDAGQGVFEDLLGFLHLLLVGGFLVHQAADVAVGRLHHRIELVCRAPAHLTPLDPGQQHGDGLRELAVVWKWETSRLESHSRRRLLSRRSVAYLDRCESQNLSTTWTSSISVPFGAFSATRTLVPLC